jgi:magnesium-transporting ATPase (P-type)
LARKRSNKCSRGVVKDGANKMSRSADKKEVEVPIENVVLDDVTLLSAGYVVLADCLLMESKDLYIDEAAFRAKLFL